MFKNVTLRGAQAAILWGYRTAGVLRTWSIRKNEAGQWVLSGTVERADAFQCRQWPLLFAPPRPGGHWCWPIEKDSLRVVAGQLTAKLGQPEL